MDLLALVISVLSALASAVTFFVTILNALRVRKALYLKLKIVAFPAKTYAIDKTETNPEKAMRNSPFGCFSHMIFLYVINPSNVPISYFDLEVTDERREIGFRFPVQAWLETENLRDFSYELPNDPTSYRIMLPDDVCGEIAANSYRPLMLLIALNDVQKVCVSLKITRRTFFKSKKHSIPERFKTVSKKIKLT